MRRRVILLACVALAAVQSHAMAEGQAPGRVNVLYAGSLVTLMEHGIGPAFDQATGGTFEGYAGGSNKLANEIKGRLRQADVFISANPRVNDDLAGPANGNRVSWYVIFAQSPLVIGYAPNSQFAAALKSRPWYEVLQEPGIRIGRTDPRLDPKGKFTLELLDKAEKFYQIHELSTKILGSAENPAQVFPEETLVGRLQSGQLDVGFFYSTETTDLKIPSIKVAGDVALSAHYTVTALNGAANPAGADRFVAFLLGRQAHALMTAHGLDITPPRIGGDAAQVPASIRAVLSAPK
jgi:molybdate/tungstate transport system substrate-binding protein